MHFQSRHLNFSAFLNFNVGESERVKVQPVQVPSWTLLIGSSEEISSVSALCQCVRVTRRRSDLSFTVLMVRYLEVLSGINGEQVVIKDALFGVLPSEQNYAALMRYGTHGIASSQAFTLLNFYFLYLSDLESGPVNGHQPEIIKLLLPRGSENKHKGMCLLCG